MNSSSAETETAIESVAAIEQKIALADIAIAAAQESAEAGDHAATTALSRGIKLRRKLAADLLDAKQLEAAQKKIDAARGRHAAKLELVDLDATIAARRPLESEHGERVARARLDVEEAEREALVVLRESEVLLRRRAHLAATSEGKPIVGHGGMIAPDFRLALLAELARRKLLPSSAPTRFERSFGSLFPATAPVPTATNETNDGPMAANGKGSSK